MRFLFYVPGTAVVRGGVSVIMEVIEVLNANGFEAVALYDRPDFEYNLHVAKAPRVWSASACQPKKGPKLRRVMRSFRDYALSRGLKPTSNAKLCPEWTVLSGDVVVVPEYVAGWLPEKLPQSLPLILFNQNPYALLRAFTHPKFRKEQFAGSLSASEACSAGSRMVLGTEPAKVPLYISDEIFAYNQDKKFQVAYMPRKRKRDVVALVKLLKATPCLEDIPFVPIDGVSTSEAARLLRESLFFLSFSEREGFGLPVAEAIATGALAIGYTGIGGDEFFNDKTGFPVPEDNLMVFYETVVKIVSRYQEEPEVFDAFRLQASETILQAYSRRSFEQETIRFFSEFKKSL